MGMKVVNYIKNKLGGLRGFLKAFSSVGKKIYKMSRPILKELGLDIEGDIRTVKQLIWYVRKALRTHKRRILIQLKKQIQKIVIKFLAKMLERKVFEKTKAAVVLIPMRKAPKFQAKIQKIAFSFFNKLHTSATGTTIERRIQSKIFRNINWLIKIVEYFVPPVKKLLNMKPFGITLRKEIDNLQMDIINQILRDYKLKARRGLARKLRFGKFRMPSIRRIIQMRRQKTRRPIRRRPTRRRPIRRRPIRRRLIRKRPTVF